MKKTPPQKKKKRKQQLEGERHRRWRGSISGRGCYGANNRRLKRKNKGLAVHHRDFRPSQGLRGGDPREEERAQNALSPWLSPSTLLYGTRTGSPYSNVVAAAAAAAAAPSFPYPAALPWPWQPPPPVAMISRRSSPPTATSLRYAPYPPTASTPPPLRARPTSPN
ncbi:hypothetical protein X777_16942 [Ooceraea biroi]|uniref:Uncharacterized protein n=1 Tax=Ooceraea biroi TaxID=2015173 RepID=A0A026WSH2_OOCBI|nr:hypothetical protein X777_16942 [Ooceraea biroi]